VVAGVVALAVLGVDQATKAWAVDRLGRGPIHVVGTLDLALTYNSGSAFSLAQGWGPVLAAFAVVAVVVMLTLVHRVPTTAVAVGLGLVVGGALGNLTDRLVRPHGSVVDFVALHFWPTFNVADACIVVGAVVSALLLVRGDPAG